MGGQGGGGEQGPLSPVQAMPDYTGLMRTKADTHQCMMQCNETLVTRACNEDTAPAFAHVSMRHNHSAQ